MWLSYLVVITGGCIAVVYPALATGASCLGIIGVRFDYAAGRVVLRRRWSTTTLPLAALAGYHADNYPSGRNRPVPSGWVLETNDGRWFELTSSNFKTLPLLEGDLTRLGVPRRNCSAPRIPLPAACKTHKIRVLVWKRATQSKADFRRVG